MPGAAHGADTAERGARELRVVSLAPTLTESLFAIGAGPQLAAVTRYCDYPPEAALLPKVGGYLDPAYEAIAAARPDLIVVLEEHSDLVTNLRRMKLRTATFRNESVSDIRGSIIELGRLLDRSAEAQRVVQKIDDDLARLKSAVSALPTRTVLISVGGHEGGGRLDRIYAAGVTSIFTELLAFAGGKNAVPVTGARYPTLSAEGVINVDPELIIDLVPFERLQTKRALLESWKRIPGLRAAASDQIYIFTEEHMVNPGPRLALIVETLACVLHEKELSFCPEGAQND